MHRLFVMLWFCVSPFALAADGIDHLHALHGYEYFPVSSDATGRDYHVYVATPQEMPEDASLPVVYLLDGGAMFPMLAAYHRYLVFAEEAPAALIVGVAFDNPRDRSTDYTAPSPERSYWGGAERYQAFLADELFPLIESRFPADPAARFLFGHSLGGQFVLYSAQTRPALFRGHIASNPALHRNLPYFLALEPRDPAHTRVFVGYGSNDGAVFREPRRRWLEHWQGKAARGWNLAAQELADHTHMSTPPVVYREAMRSFLREQP